MTPTETGSAYVQMVAREVTAHDSAHYLTVQGVNDHDCTLVGFWRYGSLWHVRWPGQCPVGFPRKRAAAAYCLQLISEHLGIDQLVLPDCTPLPKLPMTSFHIGLIAQGNPRPKTTTWRSVPHCGRYRLVDKTLKRVVKITLAYRGEVWYRDLLNNEQLLAQKVASEGYKNASSFRLSLRGIYRGVATAFFRGERPFHEHEIVAVERL